MKTNHALCGLISALLPVLTLGYVSTASASLITASVSNSASAVNLTSEGTTDWVSWKGGTTGNGTSGVSTNPYASKNGGTAIGTVVYNGGSGSIPTRYLNEGTSATTFSWTNGDPTDIWALDGSAHISGSQSLGFIQALAPNAGGQGTSFTFSVTATTTGLEHLKIYTGDFRANGLMTLSLSGATTQTVSDNVFAQDFSTFSIDFQANNVGDVLTATWADTGSNGAFSNIEIIGATLSAPDGGSTLALLGLALGGVAAVRRKLGVA